MPSERLQYSVAVSNMPTWAHFEMKVDIKMSAKRHRGSVTGCGYSAARHVIDHVHHNHQLHRVTQVDDNDSMLHL